MLTTGTHTARGRNGEACGPLRRVSLVSDPSAVPVAGEAFPRASKRHGGATGPCDNYNTYDDLRGLARHGPRA